MNKNSESVSHNVPKSLPNRTLNVTRGKDINNLKKSLKKHRGGLSHRLDMHFEDLQANIKKNHGLIIIALDQLAELKKTTQNDIASLKASLEFIQIQIKNKHCCDSSCSSSDMETDESEGVQTTVNK